MPLHGIDKLVQMAKDHERQMAGLAIEQSGSIVIRPGDHLVIPTVGNVTARDADRIREALAVELPGVQVAFIGGVTAGCGWLVYRP